MKRIPLDDAIEQLTEEFRSRLEADADDVTHRWFEVFGETGQIVEDGEGFVLQIDDHE